MGWESIMHARITQCGQEQWFHLVTSITSDGRYIRLTLEEYPHAVSFWQPMTKFLLCADGPEVTATLREEHPDGVWHETNA